MFFNNFVNRLNARIRGQVINISQDETYDMGGVPMIYCTYLVQLENNSQILLYDGISNSHVDNLGLSVGDYVVVNGFGKLVR